MNTTIARTLELWLPPAIYGALRSRFGNRFQGDYESWDEAKAACGGYDDAAVVEGVAAAAQAVVDGRAAYERDAEQFAEIQYSWPVLACLLLIAYRNNGCLRVVDFGGSLGTTYRQNSKFLSGLSELRWGVVEQSTFVTVGQSQFTTDQLSFFAQLDAAIRDVRPHVVLLSGVLQYLPNPNEVLDSVLSQSVEYLLFDRTPVIAGERDRLTVQSVPRHINKASYPAWFFSRTALISKLESHFALIEKFASNDRANVPSAEYLGFLWQRRRELASVGTQAST